MSSGGIFSLCISSVTALVRAITDLQLAYSEQQQVRTADGKTYKVDVVVTDANNRQIGFAKQKDGTCTVIADSAGLTTAQLKKQRSLINKIKQRYAYNKIVEELNKQGYQIIEEKKEAKDKVRLLARRWVS